MRYRSVGAVLTMTGNESRTLRIDDRVCWGTMIDFGTVVATAS
jgi:hypothetical protein